jgi:spore germination cell wall hydrolase CwlJ-like protein
MNVHRSGRARPKVFAGALAALLVAAGWHPQAAGQRHAAYTREDRRCLALAMYWEARGEGRTGMRAVGSVVLIRVANAKFPNTVCGVVHQGGETPPCQFSWWCDGRSDTPRDSGEWRLALAVAADLLADRGKDPTHGALFFHSAAIPVPWRVKRTRTARILDHIYYR